MKNVFELVTDIVIDVYKDISKTLTETSEENNKVLANLNDKLLEIMNDRDMMASYLLWFFSKITNLEYNGQLKLVKDLDSNGVNDLLINKTLPVTLFKYWLKFRDSDKTLNWKESF